MGSQKNYDMASEKINLRSNGLWVWIDWQDFMPVFRGFSSIWSNCPHIFPLSSFLSFNLRLYRLVYNMYILLNVYSIKWWFRSNRLLMYHNIKMWTYFFPLHSCHPMTKHIFRKYIFYIKYSNWVRTSCHDVHDIISMI